MTQTKPSHAGVRIGTAFALAVLVCATVTTRAAINVGPGGTGNLTFDTTPAPTEFSTGVLTGNGTTFTDGATMDAGVANVSAANIVRTLPTSGTVPPGTFSGGFRHNTAALYLQSRPTTDGTNAAGVLLATLQNNIGDNASAFDVSYDFGINNAASGQLPGFRVYYSLSGAPSSWIFIPSLSDTEVAGRHSASVSVTWPAGSTLYLLWADDNADGITDPSYTIDNFVVTATPANVTSITITNQPQSQAVAERGVATFTVGASGAPQHFFWFSNNVQVPGNDSATFSIPSAAYPDNNNAQIYVVVSNAVSFITSATATLTVIQDTTPPAVVSAHSGPSNNVVSINFNEAMNPALIDPANFTVYPTGTDPDASPLLVNTATLNNGTNIVLVTDLALTVGVNYSVRMLDLQDASSAQNTVDPNPLTADLAVWLQPVDFAINGTGGADSIWKFTAETNLFGTGWESVGYDDSAWLSGGAPLGVDASAGTGPQPAIVTPTAYAAHSEPQFFRRHFTMPPFVPAQTTFTLRHVFEDGAVVFINGQEAGRYNVAAGIPLQDGVRATVNQTDPTPITGPVPLPLTNVVIGDNVIAVVVLQNGATSSDSMMALELNVQMPEYPNGPATITANPVASTNVNEGQAFSLTSGAKGALPLYTEWRRNGTAVGVNPTYAVAAAIPTDAGSYVFYASNALGQATSTVALVAVNADTLAPTFDTALAATNLTNIVLTFSEPLDQAIAEDLGNYDVHLTAGGGSLIVNSATLVNNTSVVLHVSALTSGQNYTVDTFNLVDRAFAQNPVTPASLPLTQTIVIFPFSHAWKYLDDGSDQGTAWQGVGFNDGAWPSGAGILGFETSAGTLTLFTNLAGGSGTNTVLSMTNNSGGGVNTGSNFINVTVYFRATVNISSFNPAAPGNSLYARYYIDDGAAVYVNGGAQMHFNLTNGVNYTNFATAGLTETSQTLIVSNVAGFVQGNNTIAAEVHQDSLASSDIDWGMQLEAFVTTFSAAGPTLHVVNNGNGTVTVSWSGGGILQSTTNLQNAGTVWTDVPGNPNPYTFAPVPGQNTFFSLR